MKSAILVKSKKALVVDNIEIPKQLFYGQVLVKIKYSGICGSQINDVLIEDEKKILQLKDFKKNILKLSYGKKNHFLVKII